MKIVFFTLIEVSSIQERGIYHDLLRKFRDMGHDVTIVTPVERRKKIKTNYKQIDGVSILQVKTFNIQKTSVIEKGIGTLAIEYQFLAAVKKYLELKRFDLVLYSTPPITFVKVIEYIKTRDNAYTYLLLKDIFPQNAVDMKMIKAGGFLHRLFQKKEKRLYKVSDTIGCMSPANLRFVLNNNPEVSYSKVEVNPNTIEPISLEYSISEKLSIREKHKIPLDKKILIYGGNLGKPQGLDFLLETILSTKLDEVFFLIVGDGTEFSRINKWFERVNPKNAKLMQRLPKLDYDTLLASCEVGLIFLDQNFLIPNFPSRFLSYLEMGIPVLSATDSNTDIGKVIEDNHCGLHVMAGNQTEMQEKLRLLLNSDLTRMGQNAKNLLLNSFNIDITYNLIVRKLK
jgi:glycosyltransferase involved in cell wall biosynthesis